MREAMAALLAGGAIPSNAAAAHEGRAGDAVEAIPHVMGATGFELQAPSGLGRRIAAARRPGHPWRRPRPGRRGARPATPGRSDDRAGVGSCQPARRRTARPARAGGRRTRPPRPARCTGEPGARPARGAVTANSWATIPPKLTPSTRAVGPARRIHDGQRVGRTGRHPVGAGRRAAPAQAPVVAGDQVEGAGRTGRPTGRALDRHPEPIRNSSRGPVPRRW